MTGPMAADPPSRRFARAAVPVQVWLRGAFPLDIGDDARLVIAALVAQAAGPVRRIRIRLGAHRDPAVHFPVVAEASATLAGGPVRAQLCAATAGEALPALRDRLRSQLERAGLISSESAPPWRYVPPPHPWVAPFPRPPETRQVVRYKPWRLARLTVDEAVAEMERRDYGFHLFTEAGSGQDSVVYHAGPAGYRLTQLCPDPVRLTPHTVPLTCYDRCAPTLTTARAMRWLGMCEVGFLLFRHPDRDGGRVLYRRFDGHYGLLCPPGS